MSERNIRHGNYMFTFNDNEQDIVVKLGDLGLTRMTMTAAQASALWRRLDRQERKERVVDVSHLRPEGKKPYKGRYTLSAIEAYQKGLIGCDQYQWYARKGIASIDLNCEDWDHSDNLLSETALAQMNELDGIDRMDNESSDVYVEGNKYIIKRVVVGSTTTPAEMLARKLTREGHKDAALWVKEHAEVFEDPETSDMVDGHLQSVSGYMRSDGVVVAPHWRILRDTEEQAGAARHLYREEIVCITEDTPIDVRGVEPRVCRWKNVSMLFRKYEKVLRSRTVNGRKFYIEMKRCKKEGLLSGKEIARLWEVFKIKRRRIKKV